MLNLNDKAYENFRMINPIEHTRTKEESSKYKVEPYVMPADVYGQGNLAGRGGWTWYTGSASWMYIAGIKYILGLNIKNGYLELAPHIPIEWKEYSIKYKIFGNVYNIRVINKNEKHTNTEQIVESMICNGEKIEDKKIKIQENTGIYNIEVYIS
jgi:cellobiose phosphorylase